MKIKRIIMAMAVSLLAALVAGNLFGQNKPVWNGQWTITSRYRPATLKIKPLAKGKFHFTLSAMTGANMGDVEGTAVIKGNKAFFDDRKFAKKEADPPGCKLTFVYKRSLITVEQSDECRYYAGMNVYFGGDYLKGKQRKFTETFVGLEVFPNGALEKQFKLLTKKDYETFLNAFHQIYAGEDLDKLGAKVFAGCIEGICPWYAGNIMYDEKGNIWAAILRAEDKQKPDVRYYTNAAGWTEKLPKTLENWVDSLRDENEGLKVVFMNKKK